MPVGAAPPGDRVTGQRRRGVQASGPAPRDEFEFRRATQLDVVAAVRRLPARQREVVVLRYFLDLGEAEIAQTLGINVGRLSRSWQRPGGSCRPGAVELRARVGDD